MKEQKSGYKLNDLSRKRSLAKFQKDHEDDSEDFSSQEKAVEKLSKKNCQSIQLEKSRNAKKDTLDH